jgi:rhodanese-related sulfurtransferase
MQVIKMRIHIFVLLAAAMVSITALIGCNSSEGKTGSTVAPAATSQTATKPADDVQRISIAEARAAFDSGKAVIIDVRGEASYNAGHIKGAKVIAVGEISARAGELPRDKTIILYCSCGAEQSSIAAARALKGLDITNTAALVGGYPAWKNAGYPIEEPPK